MFTLVRVEHAFGMEETDINGQRIPDSGKCRVKIKRGCDSDVRVGYFKGEVREGLLEGEIFKPRLA